MSLDIDALKAQMVSRYSQLVRQSPEMRTHNAIGIPAASKSEISDIGARTIVRSLNFNPKTTSAQLQDSDPSISTATSTQEFTRWKALSPRIREAVSMLVSAALTKTSQEYDGEASVNNEEMAQIIKYGQETGVPLSPEDWKQIASELYYISDGASLVPYVKGRLVSAADFVDKAESFVRVMDQTEEVHDTQCYVMTGAQLSKSLDASESMLMTPGQLGSIRGARSQSKLQGRRAANFESRLDERAAMASNCYANERIAARLGGPSESEKPNTRTTSVGEMKASRALNSFLAQGMAAPEPARVGPAYVDAPPMAMTQEQAMYASTGLTVGTNTKSTDKTLYNYWAHQHLSIAVAEQLESYGLLAQWFGGAAVWSLIEATMNVNPEYMHDVTGAATLYSDQEGDTKMRVRFEANPAGIIGLSERIFGTSNKVDHTKGTDFIGITFSLQF